MFTKLQYISQGETAAMQLKNITEALDAGCSWVQLRFKNSKKNELKTTAEEVKKLCDTYTATFIINDHPVIAKEVDADGVHLGLTDMRISEAKNIIGANNIFITIQSQYRAELCLSGSKPQWPKTNITTTFLNSLQHIL